MFKISVVVPIYNSEKYLDKCIKSVLNQTFKQFELILVNDGSIDRSLEICKKYSNIDSRIKVINKKNEGSIITRQIGANEATGEYITFIDSDDWIANNTLETVVKEIEKNNSDVVVFNMCNVLNKFRIIRKKCNETYFKRNSLYTGENIKNDLVTAYFHGHPFPASLCAKVYKREYLKGSGEYLKKIKFLGDDLFLNMEVLLKVTKVSMINEVLYYYRKGGYTSKYMPYLFNDMIEGYRIQKKVIGNFFRNTEHSNLNGPSIMLLNTFNTYLSNIFLSDMTDKDIKDNIASNIDNPDLREAINNKGVIKCFDYEYLKSIRNKDIEYLYKKGKEKYNKDKYKRALLKVLS